MKKLLLMFLVVLTSFVSAQPTIDGDMGDSQYSTIGTFTSGRNGFGDNNDLGVLKFFTNGTDIYIGITGELTSNDNIVVFFDFSGYNGRGTNTLAGTSTSTIGVFTTSSGGLDGAKMDAGFDVDFAFAFNEGNGTTNLFMDAARFGSGTSGYLATTFEGQTTDQTGTAVTIDATSTTGGSGSLSLAYNNSFASNTSKGIEFRVPIASFSGVTNTQNLKLFVLITSSTGFMSNECIPGDPGASNLGNDADLSSISGQQFYTSDSPLPVELTSFSAKLANNAVLLNWSTATEVNNYGFEIERKSSSENWTSVSFIPGAGTSNSPKEYTYSDNTVQQGVTYQYRLKQIDTDGSIEYSRTIEVFTGMLPQGFVLDQNYPNPFNPSTTIRFGFNDNTKAALKVYNTLGLEVAELFNGIADAGRMYEVEFNGAGLASGTYLYKLITPSGEEVKKMQLLK